jgi:hypothetical protein
MSAARVHDGQIVLIAAHKPVDATCRALAASLLAFSIEDGELQTHIPLFSNKGDTKEQPGSASAHAIANSPLILDHSTRAGTCLRHYYLGSNADNLVHTSASCRIDTFGRQSWRQLR